MTLQIYLPPGFDRDQATFLATLVDTAYDMFAQWGTEGHPAPDAFRWEPRGPALTYSAPLWGTTRELVVFHEHEPFAFVASQGEQGYVVFRGTQTPEDALSDLSASQRAYGLAPDYGDAHAGFVAVYQTISTALRAAVEALPATVQRLWVAGHSMGSAFTTLAVPDLLAHTRFPAAAMVHINLASPRVASPSFAKAYAQNGVATYRLVNTCDLVPELPPAVLGSDLYTHVGIPIDFTLQRGSLAGNHSAKDTYRFALETAELLT